MKENTIRVNAFEVSFSEAGHPIWTTITFRGEKLCTVDHSDALDLAHALEWTAARLKELIQKK